ncbi:MAG: hypothetical protein ABI132_12065 [Rhodanobacteraceae bacterium]
MKTTIEIADELVSRAKRLQKRDDVTLRALVEEGLRLVLDRHAQKTQFKFLPIVVGEPCKPGAPVLDLDVNELIAESNDRSWLQREFGRSAVHESGTSYRARKKRAVARKRKG